MKDGKNSNPDFLHFDKKAFMEKISGKEKAYLQMVEVSLASITEYLNRIREAIRFKKFEEVADLGHTIKGAAATMCFSRLNELALSLEKAQPDQDEMTQLLNEMVLEFDIIKGLIP